MLKKLLILPILGSILGLGAFASADTVDGFTSDSEICSYTYSDTTSVGNYGEGDCSGRENDTIYACIVSSDTPYVVSYYPIPVSDVMKEDTVSSSYHCIQTELGDYTVEFNKEMSLKYYVSSSPITYSSSSDNGSSDSSLGIPVIPSSFTSGLTSLVNNFGGTIANWLPTIILVALGIYSVFALFRVVRNYARSSFRG